jgi:hypothetical protein
MEEKCAVVHRQGSLLTVTFFGVIVYVDEDAAVIRHERPEVHLVVDAEAQRATIVTFGSDGKTNILAHNSTSH